MSIICYFPTPFLNEDFRSLLYRYHIVTLNKEMPQTNQELFGTRSNFTVFPRGLNKLISSFPSFSKIDVQNFIDQHTLLPVFLPFITQEQCGKIMSEVANGGNQKESLVGKLVGNKYGRSISETIKYCPCCINEDENLYGSVYIHREHQFSFIKTCIRHKVKLISQCIECGVALEYSPLHLKCNNGHSVCNNHPPEKKVLEELEQGLQLDIEYILQNHQGLNDNLIKYKFSEYLAIKGYMKKKSIKCQDFANDFINYYSESKLAELGFDIDYLYKHNTYENIFRNEKLVVNVLLILLIIRFLGGTFEKFMTETLNLSVEIPFGNGPWECKNKYCPKFGIAIITHCERKNWEPQGYYSGKFCCGYCNSIYVRRWIPGEGAKSDRVSFESNEKVKEQIISLLSIGLSYKAIASKVYRSTELVKKVIRDYLESVSQLEVACSMEEEFEQVENLKKIKFREKLKSVMFEHQELSRNHIRQKCSNAYIWLLKNDKEWLEENLPPSKLSEEHKIKWSEIDETLAVRVKEVSILLKDSNYKSRISKSAITNALSKQDSGRINNNIKDLPKTAKALQVFSETKEEYQIRYLPSIVQQLRKHYNYREVRLESVQSYRISYRDITEELKEKLIKELENLNSCYYSR